MTARLMAALLAGAIAVSLFLLFLSCGVGTSEVAAPQDATGYNTKAPREPDGDWCPILREPSCFTMETRFGFSTGTPAYAPDPLHPGCEIPVCKCEEGETLVVDFGLQACIPDRCLPLDGDGARPGKGCPVVKD